MSAPAFATLLGTGVVLVLVASVAAVLIPLWTRLARVLGAALLVSLLLNLLISGASHGVAVAAAHATLGAAMSVAAAFARLARRMFRDPLDAIACGLALSIAAMFGIFAAGPVSGTLPTSALNSALLLNPLIASASAADFDLFRTPALYSLSPIAHVRFDYPSWPLAAFVYCSIAAACVAGATITSARKR